MNQEVVTVLPTLRKRVESLERTLKVEKAEEGQTYNLAVLSDDEMARLERLHEVAGPEWDLSKLTVGELEQLEALVLKTTQNPVTE